MFFPYGKIVKNLIIRNKSGIVHYEMEYNKIAANIICNKHHYNRKDESNENIENIFN